MENSDQPCKLSWDTHGVRCKFCTSSRRKRKGGGGGGRKLKWDWGDMPSRVVLERKLNGFVAGSAPVGEGEGRIRRVRGGVPVVGRSARKLAAEMWRHLAAAQKCSGGGASVTWRPQHGRFDPLLVALDSYSPNAKTVMGGASNKCDHGCPRKSHIEGFRHVVRFLKNQQLGTFPVAYALQIELGRARNRVKELETERHLFRRKLRHMLRGINQELASWKRAERKRLFLIVDELNVQLEKKRRNCQNMGNVNSKLLNDLADAKLSTKQMMQEFEKEKSTRKFLENVCHELGQDLEEQKAKIRAMKIEYARIQEEVDEERNMMQLTEVWREERLQMKLIDAKLIFEEKYLEMNNLIKDLEAFLLRSNNAASPDVIEIIERGAQAGMDSLSIQDSKELCYNGSSSSPANDMYRIIENLQDHHGRTESQTGIDEFPGLLSPSQSSDFHNNIISPKAIESIKSLLHDIDRDSSSRIARFSENLACPADSTDGNRFFNPGTLIGKDNAENQELLNAKSKKKGPSSFRKLWKSSPYAAETDDHALKTIPIDDNLRLPTNQSNITPEIAASEGGYYYQNQELAQRRHWCLPMQLNPHIDRAMRGCIEWPRVSQRNGLKAANLFEARIESQKTQLRNVLKQRMK